MGRYIAKNIVAAGLAEICEVQLSYAIGVAQPTSVHIETFETGKVDDATISRLVREHFPLTPAGIIKHLGLRKPIYLKTAAHGHFGRKPGADGSFSWEKTDRAARLKKAARA
jgi:S-adenosylmethionine synthetase